jgi:hypothetical protein
LLFFLFATYVIAKKMGWGIVCGQQIRKAVRSKIFWAVFFVSFFFIGGPFIAKSLYYTGTPLYPFAPGISSKGVYRDTPVWPSILERGERCARTQDQYGNGRGLKQFAEHFWILAVPEKEVNNRFDYPLGLPYLLVLVPFVFIFIEDLRKRQMNLALWFCFWYWVFWWIGSQQVRFFYIPLAVMFIVVLSDERFLRRAMFWGLLISLVLACISVVRAHKADLFRKPIEVLREKDKRLLGMSQTVDRNKPVMIDFEDAAFADFAIDVAPSDSIFVLER